MNTLYRKQKCLCTQTKTPWSLNQLVSVLKADRKIITSSDKNISLKNVDVLLKSSSKIAAQKPAFIMIKK